MGERGAAAVEMAFVTIFLALLVTGIIDVGRAIFVSVALADAAQEGVTFLAFTDEIGGSEVTEAQVIERVTSSISAPDLDPATDVRVWCIPVPRADVDGATVEVLVRHDLELITPIVGQMLGGSITLQRRAVGERLIGPPPSWCEPPP